MKKHAALTILGLWLMVFLTALLLRRRCRTCNGTGRVCPKCGEAWDMKCSCPEAGNGILCLDCQLR